MKIEKSTPCGIKRKLKEAVICKAFKQHNWQYPLENERIVSTSGHRDHHILEHLHFC